MLQLRYLKSGGDTSTAPEKVLPVTVFNPSTESIAVSKLITLPDKAETLALPVPSHYLLECFLHQGAYEVLFSTVPKSHPILQLECYFSLGEAVNTISTSLQNLPSLTNEFGGLILYFSAQRLRSLQLRNLKFISGAKLCLIARDREELREEIVRLDLEDSWRFRFRDEFKTASKDSPIYFLTGTYV
eukprot:sb/3471302/